VVAEPGATDRGTGAEMPPDAIDIEPHCTPDAHAGAGKLRLLTRDQLDGRTKAAQKFDAVAHAIAEDLGGEDRLSAIEKHLVEAFAGVSIHLGDIHARLLLGERINICEHATAVSTMVRIASRVGVRRVVRDVTPTVGDYVRHIQSEEADA
jgi:hypothetical protein